MLLGVVEGYALLQVRARSGERAQAEQGRPQGTVGATSEGAGPARAAPG